MLASHNRHLLSGKPSVTLLIANFVVNIKSVAEQEQEENNEHKNFTVFSAEASSKS
jgi:hypothetical protein